MGVLVKTLINEIPVAKNPYQPAASQSRHSRIVGFVHEIEAAGRERNDGFRKYVPPLAPPHLRWLLRSVRVRLDRFRKQRALLIWRSRLSLGEVSWGSKHVFQTPSRHRTSL